MRVALDTNILAYAEGVNGSSMQDTATQLLDRLSATTCFLPVQTLGELFSLLVRKAGRSRDEARTALRSWHDAFPVIETSESILLAGADLAADHNLHFWDAIILAAASEARCRLLLSEDLQEGFTWSGVIVTNPFRKPMHPLLENALAT